jgi:hypothetical protein
VRWVAPRIKFRGGATADGFSRSRGWQDGQWWE